MPTRHLTRLPHALVLALALPLTTAVAQLQDGGFEQQTGNFDAQNGFLTYWNGQTFGGGWRVVGTADLKGYYLQAHSGQNSADLHGPFRGGIYQVVNTTPGAWYDINFWLAGNLSAFKQVTVHWGGLSDAFVVGSFNWRGSANWSYQNMEWQRQSLPRLQATGSSTILYFRSTSPLNDGHGPVIDDVEMVEVADQGPVTTTPEPVTLGLVAAGVGVIACGVRRRRSA